MSPDLLVKTVKYKKYFLVISGIYDGRKLTVFDNQLNKINELDFDGIQMWAEEFHIDEEKSKILISVITTETFPLESKKYQGYELKEISGDFALVLVDKWEKSDIKGIKSKVHNGERTWVALRELNYISQTGNKGKNSFIGVAKSTNFEVPNFEYSVSNQHSHLSQNFDIELTEKNIFVSGIGSIANDTATILRLSRNRKNMEFIELDIPLKKLHNFHDSVIKKIGNQLLAYFWITSSEYCKKYTFELYSVNLKESLSDCTFLQAIKSDYVHSFAWSSNGVAYKIGKGSTPCRLGNISESGEIIEFEELEIVHPQLLTESGELIGTTEDRRQLIKIK